MAPKHLFFLVATAWVLLWVFQGLAVLGIMGGSVALHLIFLGLALLPPGLAYLLFFHAAPWLIRRFKKHTTEP